MAEDRDPLRQLIDVAVYAPIGLLTLAQRELPQLVAAGKTRVDNQITIAKFVGKMAIRQGKKQFDKRLGDANTTVEPDVLASPLADEPNHDGDAESLPAAIIEAVAHSPVLVEADALPIEGYDSLAASQVVLRLGSLTPAELDAIEHYESNHRARRTILGKITQIRTK